MEHDHAIHHPSTTVPPARRAPLLPGPARHLVAHRPAPAAANPL